MSIEPGAIVMRNGRYGYQARIVRGDYAAKQEFTVFFLPAFDMLLASSPWRP